MSCTIFSMVKIVPNFQAVKTNGIPKNNQRDFLSPFVNKELKNIT